MTQRTSYPPIVNVGVSDPTLPFFDRLMPTSFGTSYNAYLVRGATKTALIDAVEPPHLERLLTRLREAQVERLDYLISLHTEQDHAGGMRTLCEHFPEASVVCTNKVKTLLDTHVHIPEDRFLIKEADDTIDLGGRTLQVKPIPFAHWPDNTMVWLQEDNVLFTSDLFGSHYALSDEDTLDRHAHIEQAKVYFSEIMLPFRAHAKKHTDAVRALSPRVIMPAHGPIWDEPDTILDLYDDWTSDAVRRRVVIVYATMHDSTRTMTAWFEHALKTRGIDVVSVDVSDPTRDLRVSVGHAMHAAMDAAVVVFATPTVLGGPHPTMAFAAGVMNALKPKARRLALIGSFGWGTQVEKQMQGLCSSLKADWFASVLMRGCPLDEDMAPLVHLADDMAAYVASV